MSADQPDFADRAEAGARLAEVLSQRSWRNPVVLGIPRGGVVVAAAVADALGAPLDAIFVRKLGVPEQPELALGGTRRAQTRRRSARRACGREGRS